MLMGWFILPQILLIAYRKRLFDIVDNRKVHVGIIPRLGGISFAPTQCCLIVLSIFFMRKLGLYYFDALKMISLFLLLICGMVLLFLVGIKDDLIGVNYRWKFVMQLVAASLFPLSNLWINNLYGIMGINALSPWIGMPMTVFLIVFIINAINLIDGIDGLCSGLAIIGCFVLGTLFISGGAWLHAVFAFITAGVLLPFFYYNVFGISKSRHRIFMGDAGSLTLGLSLSFLVISSSMYNPAIMPPSHGAIVIAFATLIVPMFDVLRVVLVRLHLHRPIFKPDCSHIHHKLLKMGFSHRNAMVLILSMVLVFNILNIITVRYFSNSLVLCMDIIIWSAFHLWLFVIKNLQSKQKISKQLKEKSI